MKVYFSIKNKGILPFFKIFLLKFYNVNYEKTLNG